MQYRRISADCHLDMIWLPPDLFTSQAPRDLKDRMPFVAEGPHGKEWVANNGASFGLVGGVGSAGRLYEPGKQHRADRMLPDYLAPAPFTMWGFGFRDVTGLTQTQIQNQRGHFQASAPQLCVDQYVHALHNDVQISLTNLGLWVRPDLTDAHTIHWHGFRNAHPVLRRRARAVDRGPARPELHLCVPAARSRDVHVPLPLRGRRARVDGHDRDRLRPARPELGSRLRSRPASTSTTTASRRRARAPRPMTASGDCSSARAGRRSTTTAPTSRSTTGRSTTPTCGS